MFGNKPTPNPRPNGDSDMLGLISVLGCDNPNRLGDVVFVHGLAGHAWNTWHWQNPNDKDYQKNNCWLNWLGKDLKDSGVEAGIWTFGYSAARLRANGSAMPLFDQASNLLDDLENFDFGRRPIIFVTHSMGGLLVKKMLSTAENFPRDKRKKAVIDSTKGIVFLSTPHLGSDLAQWVKSFTGFLSTVSVEELKAHAPQLRELDEWYRQHVGEFGIATKVYYETRPTSGVLVVNASSANPGIVDVKPIAIDADHDTIAKPKPGDNKVYLGVKNFIKDYLQSSLESSEDQSVSEKEDKSSQAPPSISNFYLQGAQFGGGIINADIVNANQIGGNIINQPNPQKAPSTALRLKKNNLEKRLADYEKDYEGLERDLRAAGDADVKNRLQFKLDSILEEMKKIEKELNQINHGE